MRFKLSTQNTKKSQYLMLIKQKQIKGLFESLLRYRVQQNITSYEASSVADIVFVSSPYPTMEMLLGIPTLFPRNDKILPFIRSRASRCTTLDFLGQKHLGSHVVRQKTVI